MRKISLLLGPIVFLIAQFLWVEGSADNAQKVLLIRDNVAMWTLSHQLFALYIISHGFAFHSRR